MNVESFEKEKLFVKEGIILLSGSMYYFTKYILVFFFYFCFSFLFQIIDFGLLFLLL